MGIPGVLGFLGFGNMGQAIANGLVQAGTIAADHILVFDVNGTAAATADTIGAVAVESAATLANRSTILLLAPKPQDMAAALESIAGHLAPEALLISIAAGVSFAFIQSTLGAGSRVARVMPNTPALVGAGAAGFAMSDTCTNEDADITQTIFESIGIAEKLPEKSIDAVTALSGSGPAYYFAVAEACVKAGVGLGLPEDQATRLAGQTLYGAGLLLKESGESAATLRQRVTSKGGTTEAALECMNERGLEDTIRAAMEAAAERSQELGH